VSSKNKRKMTQIDKQTILSYWKEVVEKSTKLTKVEDVEKVCEFVHGLSLEYDPNVLNNQKTLTTTEKDIPNSYYSEQNMLALSLKVLKELQSLIDVTIGLTNVIFVDLPIYEDLNFIKEIESDGTICIKKSSKIINTKKHYHKIKIQKELFYDTSYNEKALMIIKDIISSTIANKINEGLQKGHKFFIYHLVDRVYTKFEKIGDPDYIEIEFVSRWFEEEIKTMTVKDL